MTDRSEPTSCGRSHEEWLSAGCGRGASVFDTCEQCETWEVDYWDQVEKGGDD